MSAPGDRITVAALPSSGGLDANQGRWCGGKIRAWLLVGVSLRVSRTRVKRRCV